MSLKGSCLSPNFCHSSLIITGIIASHRNFLVTHLCRVLKYEMKPNTGRSRLSKSKSPVNTRKRNKEAGKKNVLKTLESQEEKKEKVTINVM